jgi:Undecaprenyl-phosphate glucose phosphotransferase
MFKKRRQFFQSFLMINDLFFLTLSWVGAYILRFYAPVIPVTKGVPPLSDYLFLLLFVLIIWMGTFQVTGIYRRFFQGTQEVRALFRSNLYALMILVFMTFFFKRTEFSRLVFLYFGVLNLILLSLSRWLLKGYYLDLQRRHREDERVLIVGIRGPGPHVAEVIAHHPELGLKVQGFLTRHPQEVGKAIGSFKVLGVYEDIDRIIREEGIRLVIFAMPLTAHQRLEELLNRIKDEMVDIKIVPDLYRFISLRGGIEEFEGLPFINLRESPMVGWNRVLKRAYDLVLAALLLILLSPVLLLIALVVKATSPGPILYRQTRMGLDGRIFEMLKFRSMVAGAEEETGPVWAQKEDPRRTPVGKFLRKFSLDELPQLINVLRGEMSLVGPRPERPELIERFKEHIPGYMLRHRMKAGMTGWAQINGWRGNTDLAKRIECDLYYIENWSLLLDTKILLMTLWKGIFSKEAY